MIDAPKVLLDFLLDQADLTDIVGARIWAEMDVPPQAAHYKPSDGGAIVFKRSGGNLDYSRVLLSPRWQFKCYGETTVVANTVYRKLVDVLDDRSGPGFYKAMLDVDGQTLTEPSTGWIFTLCFFVTRMRSELAIVT